MTNYVSSMQKLLVLYEGPLRQELPKSIPARQYISSAKANALFLPFTSKEAKAKFESLVKKSKLHWEIDDLKVHMEQQKLCKQLLELGIFK